MKTKFYISLLFCCFVTTALLGKNDVVFSRIQTLYSNAGILTIDKIVLTDTATVINFTAKGKINSWFLLAPSTYLSDEESKHYPVKGASGIKLGERSFIPKTGEMKFCLYFAPMSKKTKIFDFIEGTDDNMFQIYGIHDKKTKVKIPVAKEGIEPSEVSEQMFCEGKSCIRGKIEGYSRDWSNPMIYTDFSGLGQGSVSPHAWRPNSAPIDKDGCFTVNLMLDHPIWSDLKVGNRRIPFYIRPGDTLDITIKDMYTNEMAVEYQSKHFNDSYENLLNHQNIPLIHYSWERLTQDGHNLDYGHFLRMIDECTAENMRLCNYVAWKYNLSPWETHLLKNRKRWELTQECFFLASRLFEQKVTLPERRDGLREEDFTGYDYSAYKIVNTLPLNDSSLSYLPYFTSFPKYIEQTYPVVYAKMGVFHSRIQDGKIVKTEMESELEKDSMQIAILRELTGEKELSWAMQSFLTTKVCELSERLKPSERKEIVDYLSSYLTYPYFQKKIKELDSLSVCSKSLKYEIPDKQGHRYIRSILDKYKGKYVNAVWLSSPQTDYSFYLNSSVENLALDFKDNPDMQLIAIVNKDAYSNGKEYEKLRKELNFPVIYELDGDTYLKMMELFDFTGSSKQMTFDRNGLVFKRSMDMKKETEFRQRFRQILEGETVMK